MKRIVSFICIIIMLCVWVSPVSAAKKDTKAPVIAKTNPVDCTADVMIDNMIVIRFNEKILKGKSVAKISLNESGLLSIGYTYVITDNLLKITPKADLKYDTIYTLVIPAAAVKDSTGNNFAKSYTLTFITETDPAVVADTTKEQSGFKYILEIEAAFASELTDDKLEYFKELLTMVGIDATFLNISKAGEETAAGDPSVEENSGGASSNKKYSSYILLLADSGPNEVKAIKVISKITGVSLSEAKKIAGKAPEILLKDLTLDQADTMKQQLEDTGAVVTIVGIE